MAAMIFDIWVNDYKHQMNLSIQDSLLAEECESLDQALPLNQIILNILALGLAPDHITLETMVTYIIFNNMYS